MFAVWVLQVPVSLEAANPVLLKVHDVNVVEGETDAGEQVIENSQDQSADDESAADDDDDDDDEEVKAVQGDTKVDDDGGMDEYDTPAELAVDLKSAEQEYQEDQAEKKRKHDSGEDVEEEKEKFEQDKEDAKQAAAQELGAEAEQMGGTASPADIAKAEKAAVAEVVADHVETVATAKDEAESAKRDVPVKFDFDSLAATLQGKDDPVPTMATAVLKVKTAAKPVTAVKAKVVTKPMTGVKAKAHSKPNSVAKAKTVAKVNAVVKPVILKVAVKPINKKKAAAFMHMKHSDDVETDGDQALGKMFEEAPIATDTATSDDANDGESADDESMVPSGEGAEDAIAFPSDEDSEPALLQTVHADVDDIESDEEETGTVDDDSEDEASDDDASSETETAGEDDSEDDSDDASSEIEKQDAAIEAASDDSDIVDASDELTEISAEEDE